MGVVTNVPWAVGFNGELRHETAMYSILANLTIFLILWFWLRKKNFPKGTLFAIFLIWYAVARFITDFFRAYDLPYSDPRFFVFGNFGGLTISQIISIAIFVLGIWLVFYLKKSKMPARG
ncbi:MAG: hypothetical protein ACD_63C00069G0004 [uncultured bacterium]|nr:MAG: hypothetical protein ACD_63C00069G0004 [uncultured bacterium]